MEYSRLLTPLVSLVLFFCCVTANHWPAPPLNIPLAATEISLRLTSLVGKEMPLSYANHLHQLLDSLDDDFSILAPQTLVEGRTNSSGGVSVTLWIEGAILGVEGKQEQGTWVEDGALDGGRGKGREKRVGEGGVGKSLGEGSKLEAGTASMAIKKIAEANRVWQPAERETWEVWEGPSRRAKVGLVLLPDGQGRDAGRPEGVAAVVGGVEKA